MHLTYWGDSPITNEKGESMIHSNPPKVDIQDHESVFEKIGDSLRKAYDSAGMKLALVGLGAVLLGGCQASPGMNSKYNNSYTSLPAPPANARLQIGVTAHGHEDTYDILINYIEWNSSQDKFVRRDVHYSAYNQSGFGGYDDHFTERGGYEQNIYDGEVLASGAIVDQVKKVIYLPGGNIMDGPTGKVFASDGRTIIKVPTR